MDQRLAAKAHTELLATRLVQQSSLWGGVKKRTGWTPRSFDLWLDGKAVGDVLILERDVVDGASLVYVPFGPEALPDAARRARAPGRPGRLRVMDGPIRTDRRAQGHTSSRRGTFLGAFRRAEPCRT